MTTITNTMTAEEAYNIALNDPVRRITDKNIIEKAILNVLRGHRVYIIDYAENVLKKRWIEGEAVILNNTIDFRAELIVNYATNVIKGRWLEAEKILIDIAAEDLKNNHRLISKYFANTICGYEYYSDRIGKTVYSGSDNRGRWIEFEHILHQVQLISPTGVSAFYEDQHKCWSQAYEAKKCYDHARYVVKGRWIEGEEVIKKHKYWWQEYKNFIGETPAVDPKNIEIEKLKKARAELDAKIKMLESN